MSDGGLLEKATEQNPTSSLIAEITKDEVNVVGVVEAIKTVLLFGLLPIFVTRILLVYLPFDQLMVPGTSISAIMALVFLGSLGFVIFRLGLVSSAGLMLTGSSAAAASVVVVFYVLMLIFPLLLGVFLEGELTVGQVEYSDDGELITVKLLQNTMSDREVEASFVVIQSGQEVWSSTANVTIDSSSGEGELTLLVSDFYATNALPNSPYTLRVSVEGKETTRDLTYSQIQWSQPITAQWNGADALTRDITGAGGSTTGVVKKDPERCSGESDNCLVGVVLSAWAGLDTGSDKPVRMPFADYSVEAVLMEGNDAAISYPPITVVNTQATWDSHSGEFGSGSGIWGDFGSTFALEGSVMDASFGHYIPRDEFDSAGDYGCYSFTITVTQESSEPISHTSYYDYSSSGSNDIWAAVSSC